MSEITLAVQREVMERVTSKAIVTDQNGTVSVDGVVIRGTDGERALKVFLEGIEQDVKELGQAGAEKLYRDLSHKSGRLGRAVKTSINLSRTLDAETVSKG